MERTKGVKVKNQLLRIVCLALVSMTGCVSTVSEPGPLKAVVTNAETAPAAMEAARERARQQRQLFEQRHDQAATRASGMTLHQPAAVNVPTANPQDTAEEQSRRGDLFSVGAADEITYADLTPRGGNNTRAVATGLTISDAGSTGGHQVQEYPTEMVTRGLPVLAGIRVLGVVAAKGGRTRYMLKQQGQVAAVATAGKELHVDDRSYRIRGSGADGVVVEDDQGQPFLVRR